MAKLRPRIIIVQKPVDHHITRTARTWSRAKALGVSRNRLIVRALEQAANERSGWAPEFLEQLRNVDCETVPTVDELLAAVKQARRSKEPHDL